MEGYSSLLCICVCVSVCLLSFDLHNCKVVLHFEYINRKLLLRMPRKPIFHLLYYLIQFDINRQLVLCKCVCVYDCGVETPLFLIKSLKLTLQARFLTTSPSCKDKKKMWNAYLSNLVNRLGFIYATPYLVNNKQYWYILLANANVTVGFTQPISQVYFTVIICMNI